MPVQGMSEQLGSWATGSSREQSDRDGDVSSSHAVRGTTFVTGGLGPQSLLRSAAVPVPAWSVELRVYSASGSALRAEDSFVIDDLRTDGPRGYERPVGLAGQTVIYDSNLFLIPFAGQAETGAELFRRLRARIEPPIVANVQVGFGTGGELFRCLAGPVRVAESAVAAGTQIEPTGVVGLQPRPPLASFVWDLVSRQQVKAARELLTHLPDESEYERIKVLLRLPTTSTAAQRDRDRTAEYAWLREHAGEYSGQWVAVSGDVLLAAAKSLRELRRHLRAASPVSPPLVHFME